MEEPQKLRDGTARLLHRVWFISPFPLDVSALELSFSKYVKANASRIRIIDGIKLLNLLYRTAPELLAELGDKYSLHVKKMKDELALLHEASAFRLRDKVSLLPIYINLGSSVLPELMVEILNGRFTPPTSVKVPVPPEDVRSWLDFGRLSAEVLKTVGDSVHQGARAGNSATFQGNGAAFCEAATRTCNDHILSLKKSLESTTADRGAALRHFHEFVSNLNSILSHPAASSLLGPQSSRPVRRPETYRINIELKDMLNSRLNFQVLGDAGAGKTTLLRVLGHEECCIGRGRLPVFVPLSTMTGTLLDLIQRRCATLGLCAHKKSFLDLLESGRVLLLLDSIDEVVTRNEGVLAQIRSFLTEFPRVQCIVTARPWAALPRSDRYFTIQILPFTPDQLRSFLTKWFGEDAAHAQQAISHLDKNRKLYEVISNPLLATTFAVIKSLGGALPTSLVELYGERLRLLLHDWDEVRGLKRDKFEAPDKLFFLRKLAFRMQCESTRTVPWKVVVEFAHEVVGAVKTKSAAEEFARELVNHNNMVLRHEDGLWGLGHLQFQEYLAAMEAKENPQVELAKFIELGWWSAVIKMYAEMTRDISKLIYDLRRQTSNLGHGIGDNERMLSSIEALLALAPNTEERARAVVEKERDIREAVAESFAVPLRKEVISGEIGSSLDPLPVYVEKDDS